MTATTIEDETGEERKFFECDVCGRVPVLDMIEEDPDDDRVADAFRDDGRLRQKYLKRGIFDIIEFDSNHVGDDDGYWEVCDQCQDMIRFLLNGGLRAALSAKEVRKRHDE